MISYQYVMINRMNGKINYEKYRVIAFDYDGTLVDTFRFHVNTIGRIVRECRHVLQKKK